MSGVSKTGWAIWRPDRTNGNRPYRYAETVEAKTAREAVNAYLGDTQRWTPTRLLVIPDDHSRTAVVLAVGGIKQERSW